MNLSDVASLLGGELNREADVEIKGVSGLDVAVEGDISFVDPKKIAEAAGSDASCLLVKDFIPDIDKPQVKVKNPQYAFAVLLGRFHETARPKVGIDKLAFVDDNADVSPDASISSFAYVSGGAKVGAGTVLYPGVFIGEGSTVGDDCTIYPNVVIREGVKIGNRVIVQPGAVIGADGFGYVLHERKHFKIPQVGGVIIGDDVEIGACTAIDRATTGNTVIGDGTKIDNLVQVAHNVEVGEHSILVSQVGIAGSCKIGSGVIMGGQAGLADHLTIADGVIIGARSGVMNDLKRGIYVGAPALPRRETARIVSFYHRLPELHDRIKDLEEKLKNIERSSGDGDD